MHSTGMHKALGSVLGITDESGRGRRKKSKSIHLPWWEKEETGPGARPQHQYQLGHCHQVALFSPRRVCAPTAPPTACERASMWTSACVWQYTPNFPSSFHTWEKNETVCVPEEGRCHLGRWSMLEMALQTLPSRGAEQCAVSSAVAAMWAVFLGKQEVHALKCITELCESCFVLMTFGLALGHIPPFCAIVQPLSVRCVWFFSLMCTVSELNSFGC